MKEIVFLFGLLFLLSTAYAADKEEALRAELINNMIPVGDISMSGDSVSIVYNLSLSHGNETYVRDSMFILGKLAKNYPDSRHLEVMGMSGGKRIFSFKAETKDVIDYAEMRIGEEEVREKLFVTNYVADCGAGKINVNGECVEERKQTGATQSEEDVIEIDPIWLVGGGIILFFGFGFIVLLIITIVILARRKRKE